MMSDSIRRMLEDVRDGRLSVDHALLDLKMKPYVDLGFAKVDLHRKTRQGVSEVIFGQGKTPHQIVEIAKALMEEGQDRLLITRVDAEKEREIALIPGFSDYAYDEASRTIVIGGFPEADGEGTILIATAGTSDVPVAEEAAITAQILGNRIVRAYDMGVAGVHRTLAHLEDIMEANVIIAIAGMEGALASLIGGLAECPVIAVPTSVGYGSAFGGMTALLSMLNSCASGVSVVNIDNGFGAAYTASLINHKR